jgi:hypothetical protein
VERRVKVKPRVNVQLASAHELIDDLRIQPDSITLQGAESVVNGLDAWPTDSLVLSDVRDTVRAEVPLRDTLSGLVDEAALAMTRTL